MISRRGLVAGLASLIAAPAIVRAESLMPVKRVVITTPAYLMVPHLYSGWARPSASGGWEAKWLASNAAQDKVEAVWLPMPPGWAQPPPGQLMFLPRKCDDTSCYFR